MKSPDAVEILIRLAKQASDERARALGGALRKESNDQERLRLLSDYRNDYLDKYQKMRIDGISALGMLNFQQFLAKLDTAIAHQQNTLINAQTATSSARVALGESERNRQSLTLLQSHRQRKAQSVELMREQKRHDEFATHSVRRSRSHSSGSD